MPCHGTARQSRAMARESIRVLRRRSPRERPSKICSVWGVRGRGARGAGRRRGFRPPPAAAARKVPRAHPQKNKNGSQMDAMKQRRR